MAGAALWAAPAFAYISPGAPASYVNDFAHVLGTETRQTLESELTQFDASTTNQIAVAIIPSLKDDYIENYAVKLFEEWKIGTKKNNNGVLLVVAVAEHKLRIEVGYGLEGALPDSLAQKIIDDEMTPRLRDGDYNGAIASAVHAIMSATRGEYTGSQQHSSASILQWLYDNSTFLIFVPIFIFQFLASILARSRSWWAGGIIGIVFAIAVGFFAPLDTVFTLILATLFGGFGFVFDYIVSNAYHSAKNSDSIPPWWAGGGGFGGSSGSSSGGFGGFGGGSSGGGGASGSW